MTAMTGLGLRIGFHNLDSLWLTLTKIDVTWRKGGEG